MKLELTRTEVCDIMLATTSIVHGAREEMNDMDTTETRRGILKGTIRKWQTLHDEIKTQLDEHDAETEDWKLIQNATTPQEVAEVVESIMVHGRA